MKPTQTSGRYVIAKSFAGQSLTASLVFDPAHSGRGAYPLFSTL
jgi:hypothetical protein